MKTIMRVVYVLLLLSVNAKAGTSGPFTGEDPRTWEYRALIYAYVEDVIPKHKEGIVVDLILRPLATLSGDFDAGKESRITAEMHQFVIVGWGSGNLTEVRAPKAGDYVVTLVRQKVDWIENRFMKVNGFYGVYSEDVTFMPKLMGIITVEGNPTQQIEEIVKAVRKVRTTRKPEDAEKK